MAMCRQLSKFFGEYASIAAVFAVALLLLCHEREIDNAFRLAASVALVFVQMVFIIYTLTYAIYRERPKAWYFLALFALIVYHVYLFYFGMTKQLIAHTILSTGPGLLFFLIVLRSRGRPEN